MHCLNDIFTLQRCQLVQILKSIVFVTHLYLCECSHKVSTKICTEKEEKNIYIFLNRDVTFRFAWGGVVVKALRY